MLVVDVDLNEMSKNTHHGVTSDKYVQLSVIHRKIMNVSYAKGEMVDFDKLRVQLQNRMYCVL
jgi:hypothetical protein